jgi:hypothetical protein
MTQAIRPRRREPGIRLRRRHCSSVGHGAAEDALPDLPRGRDPAAQGRTAGREVMAGRRGEAGPVRLLLGGETRRPPFFLSSRLLYPNA